MVQDNYLLEIRGDVREGLAPSTEDESMQSAETGDKLFYVVREYFFTCGGEPRLMNRPPSGPFRSVEFHTCLRCTPSPVLLFLWILSCHA